MMHSDFISGTWLASRVLPFVPDLIETLGHSELNRRGPFHRPPAPAVVAIVVNQAVNLVTATPIKLLAGPRPSRIHAVASHTHAPGPLRYRTTMCHPLRRQISAGSSELLRVLTGFAMVVIGLLHSRRAPRIPRRQRAALRSLHIPGRAFPESDPSRSTSRTAYPVPPLSG